MKQSRRTLFLALTVALALMLATGLVSTLAGSSSGELLKNGDFEDGFRMVDGCGMVGVDWGCFTTGGAGGYGFYDDQWEPVVASGAHAQLIEINTKEIGGDQNRTAGIYQTVHVVPGKTYHLAFEGMIRANDFADGGDPWRYVMLVGFTHNGSTNWADAQVQEVNVGPIQDRLHPSGYYHAELDVTAQSDTLTVFIAGRMKWGDWYKEVNFDIDAVSLQGEIPGPSILPVTEEPPQAAPEPVPTTQPTGQLVCDGPNLLQNGGFEEGFDADGTARKWGKFNNGGRAHYGYYDDQWGPVVAEGAHAQLLEINTKSLMPVDPNRWIGVHQRVSGLQPGATYQLSLQAMIRERADHSDEDAWRYEVYWGLNDNADKITDVNQLESLNGIPVSGIYLRTAPGPYSSFSTTFQAPSSEIRLYLLGLMKWAKPDREVNFDFDAVTLRACRYTDDPPAEADPVSQPSASVPTESQDQQAVAGQEVRPGVCTYVVQPGDYISKVAERFGTTVEWLMTYNRIPNPQLLFVGQPLMVPCGGGVEAQSASPAGQVAAANIEPPAPPLADDDLVQESDEQDRPTDADQEGHVILRGQSLSQIAFQYGVSVDELRRINHIENPQLIRPGQVIQLPSQ